MSTKRERAARTCYNENPNRCDCYLPSYCKLLTDAHTVVPDELAEPVAAKPVSKPTVVTQTTKRKGHNKHHEHQTTRRSSGVERLRAARRK